MKNTVILIFILIVSKSYSQEKLAEELIPDIEWGEGSIMLNDGTELFGMVRYNDKNGLVSFESGRDNRSFTARGIMGFEFFDEKIQRQRVFYTLEYTLKDELEKRPFFFELLSDLKKFAVLSRMDPVEIKQRVQSSPAGYSNDAIAVSAAVPTLITTINQTETVYILTPSGEIKPYLKLTRKVVDRNLYNRKRMKRKIVDKKILADYFVEPGYSKMIPYGLENELDFEDKDDFIKLLQYYKSVMQLINYFY